jgi:hypothetical protein
MIIYYFLIKYMAVYMIYMYHLIESSQQMPSGTLIKYSHFTDRKLSLENLGSEGARLGSKVHICIIIIFGSTGFELGPSCLLGRYSTA